MTLSPSTPDQQLTATLDMFLDAVLAKKALRPVVLDVRRQTTIADLFIIAGGRSHRQVAAMAEHVKRTLKQHKIRPLHIEGRKDGQWALMDYGDVVIHLFYEPVREHYDLESLWIDARRVETPQLKAYTAAEADAADLELEEADDDQYE